MGKVCKGKKRKYLEIVFNFMLYIVATPIGNLEDISFRALRILSEADLILCEDTRVTHKLLTHYKIDKPLNSFHEHSDESKISHILRLLEGGKILALVTDAGTPGISDPGGKLIERVVRHFGIDNPRGRVEVVPGPSALTAALSISGLPTDRFVFMGFPPHKKGRQTFIRNILESGYPVVVYESKYRIIKFLEELNRQEKAMFDAEKNKRAGDDERHFQGVHPVVVCRELSKMHETVYRGDLKNIIEKLKMNPEEQKGEFVVVVGK